MPCFVIREEDAKKLEKSRATGELAENAYISQAIASPKSKNMTAGYLKLDPGYGKELVSPVDEIDFFMEGSLTYTSEGQTFTARKGDMTFIEKGTKISFVTEEGCLVFYVTYPLLQETVDELTRKAKKE